MIFLLFLIVVGAVYFTLTSFKIARMNRDPAQQQLAGLLAGVGRGEVTASDIVAFITIQGWSEREVRNRVPHALTITNLIAPPNEYKSAVKVGHDIVVNYGSLNFDEHIPIRY